MSKHSIQITKIYCNHNSEVGHDEVYLTCQSDGHLSVRYPFGINTSYPMKADDDKKNTWLLDLTLNFEYEVLVTLWDQDLSFDPNLATYLQSFDFRPGQGSGSIRLTNLNEADYTIYYTYID